MAGLSPHFDPATVAVATGSKAKAAQPNAISNAVDVGFASVDGLMYQVKLVDSSSVAGYLGDLISSSFKVVSNILDFNSSNSPANAEVLSYNTALSQMEWVANGSGADTYKIRLENAASPINYLGDVLGTGLEVSGGLLRTTKAKAFFIGSL